MNGIDLFCGLGGFSLGMRQAGVQPVLGVDSWDVAVNTYGENFPQAKAVQADIKDRKFQKWLLDTYTNRVGVVCGGPPCQPFSTNNNSTKRVGSDLPLDFVKLALRLKPKVVLMEQVPTFPKFGGGAFRSRIVDQIKKHGYAITFEGVVDSSKLGLPQKRKRYFLKLEPFGENRTELLRIRQPKP